MTEILEITDPMAGNVIYLHKKKDQNKKKLKRVIFYDPRNAFPMRWIKYVDLECRRQDV